MGQNIAFLCFICSAWCGSEYSLCIYASSVQPRVGQKIVLYTSSVQIGVGQNKALYASSAQPRVGQNIVCACFTYRQELVGLSKCYVPGPFDLSFPKIPMTHQNIRQLPLIAHPQKIRPDCWKLYTWTFLVH